MDRAAVIHLRHQSVHCLARHTILKRVVVAHLPRPKHHLLHGMSQSVPLLAIPVTRGKIMKLRATFAVHHDTNQYQRL